jgi:hypothetical protein
VLGSITFLAASFLHEAVSYPRATEGAATSVADLYVFDLPASILAHLDGPVGFLTGTLEAANWSPMVSLAFPGPELTNLGEYWVFKIPLPHAGANRLFARVGYGTQLGLSRPWGYGYALSVAAGAETGTRTVDPVTLDESVTLVKSMWLSVDRHNSLLASLSLRSRGEDRLAVNLYPGVLPGKAGSLGIWLVMDGDWTTRVGIAHRSSLGMGVGRTFR